MELLPEAQMSGTRRLAGNGVERGKDRLEA
jgi:hypothetical protein